jgi:glycosyltransferase involved in cell wall biosynthesis
MRTTISVVVAAHNGAAFLRETLESVLQQSFRDFEIIVVDDGSTDATRQVVESCSHPVRYIYQDNKGQASARNTGIRLASGAYVALLDQDDIWLPDKLELQVDAIERSDMIGMVTCGLTRFDESGERGTVIPRLNGLSRKAVVRRLLYGNCIGGASCALLRRSCLDRAGLFREALLMAEEWDLWVRIARDAAIRVVERPLLRYRLHPANTSEQSAALNLENELEFLRTTLSDPGLDVSWTDRRKAYARRYVSAAWLFMESGEKRQAARCLGEILRLYPPEACTKVYSGLLWRLIRSLRAPWSGAERVVGDVSL